MYLFKISLEQFLLFIKTSYTRRLRYFAPIFYLNCDHVLFCVHFKTKKKKISRIFKIFKNFTKIKTFKHKFLKFLSFINLPLGHARSHNWYWIQTNKHPSL